MEGPRPAPGARVTVTDDRPSQEQPSSLLLRERSPRSSPGGFFVPGRAGAGICSPGNRSRCPVRLPPKPAQHTSGDCYGRLMGGSGLIAVVRTLSPGAGRLAEGLNPVRSGPIRPRTGRTSPRTHVAPFFGPCALDPRPRLGLGADACCALASAPTHVAPSPSARPRPRRLPRALESRPEPPATPLPRAVAARKAGSRPSGSTRPRSGRRAGRSPRSDTSCRRRRRPDRGTR